MISIKGLDKAEVLAALVNGTRALGFGSFHDKGRFTADDARAFVERGTNDMGFRMGEARWRFDYVAGRPLKCDLSGDEFDERLYDRDAGDGAAERALAALRAQVSP